MPYDCPGKPPHYVWRHTCASIDFTTGLTRLVENGRLVKEVTDQELVRMYQVLPLCINRHSTTQTFDSTMNSVTVGCQYRLAPTYLSLYQNMHGR